MMIAFWWGFLAGAGFVVVASLSFVCLLIVLDVVRPERKRARKGICVIYPHR
jgi:hypothetical protein